MKVRDASTLEVATMLALLKRSTQRKPCSRLLSVEVQRVALIQLPRGLKVGSRHVPTRAALLAGCHPRQRDAVLEVYLLGRRHAPLARRLHGNSPVRCKFKVLWCSPADSTAARTWVLLSDAATCSGAGKPALRRSSAGKRSSRKDGRR